MLAWKWGPALACGNTIVMKPAEQTPLTALRVGELAMEAGFPAGVINVINGLGETAGAAMVVHPDIDKIAFTGHVDTAKIIQKAAADTLEAHNVRAGRQEPQRRLRRLRHGRRPSPVPSTPSTSTAASAAPPAAGCSSRRRSIRNSSSGWPRRPRSARSAIPSIPTTEQGPQVSQEQMDKILGYVDLGQKQGAKLVTGGKRVGDKGYFVEPTIFDNVKDDMAIAKDEIFGPVVSVLPFKDVDDSDRAGQQHHLRPGRGGLDQGHRQGPPVCQAKSRPARLGQLLPHRRHDHPVRRLQDVGPGPRERRGGAGSLHRNEDRDDQARLSRFPRVSFADPR